MLIIYAILVQLFLIQAGKFSSSDTPSNNNKHCKDIPHNTVLQTPRLNIVLIIKYALSNVKHRMLLINGSQRPIDFPMGQYFII